MISAALSTIFYYILINGGAAPAAAELLKADQMDIIIILSAAVMISSLAEMIDSFSLTTTPSRKSRPERLHIEPGSTAESNQTCNLSGKRASVKLKGIDSLGGT